MFCEVFETKEKGKGKGLRATKDLSIGEKVLEEAPAVSVLSNKIRKRVCSNCFRQKEERLLWCSGCKYVRYCGQQCQKESWKKHKRECKRYPFAAPCEPSDLVRLMHRILDIKDSGEDMTWLDNLTVGNMDNMGERRRAEFSIIVGVLAHFAGERLFKKFSVPEVFGIFAKICCNSFSICDGEMQSMGIGLYDTASKFNHSCIPNCVVVFDGPQLYVRAVKKIKAGDELTISYIELLCLSETRRLQLLYQYFFACSCEKCGKPEEEDRRFYSFLCSNKDCKNAITEKGECDKCGTKTDPEKIKEWIDEADTLSSKIKELGDKHTHLKEAMDLCEKAVKEQEVLLHRCNYLFLGTLDKALDGFTMLQNWEKALQYGIRTLEPYQIVYHQYHPSIGLQFYKVGKLQLLLDQYEVGFQTLDRALEMLKVTHGDQHPTVLELKQIVAEVSEEYRQKRMQSS